MLIKNTNFHLEVMFLHSFFISVIVSYMQVTSGKQSFVCEMLLLLVIGHFSLNIMGNSEGKEHDTVVK